MSLLHWFRWLIYVEWVSLDTHSASIQRQFQLNATTTPSNATNQNIVWTSSNTNIATVEGWLVTPTWEGSVTITASVDWYTDSCTLNVSLIHVTWVTLNESSITVNAWEQEQLTATVNPSDASNPNITWSSSNTSVAVVDETGLVTYVWDGSCTITVTTEDWWYTATCSVECVSFVPIDTCFWYTWTEQTIQLMPHTYCIEVWWAEWWYSPYWWKWWYSWWCITLTSATCVYIYVWWVGATWSGASWWRNWWWISWAFWNNYPAWWWWWATDIRIWWDTLYHRRIVAGWWGWWWHNYWDDYWWYWWWLCWWKWCSHWCVNETWYSTTVATQTSWASFWCWSSWTNTWWWGGWWWYGWWWTLWEWWSWWSWYVYTSSTCSSAPNWYCHCVNYLLNNSNTCCWKISFPSPNWGTETWHAGCGCVRIRSL